VAVAAPSKQTGACGRRPSAAVLLQQHVTDVPPASEELRAEIFHTSRRPRRSDCERRHRAGRQVSLVGGASPSTNQRRRQADGGGARPLIDARRAPAE